MRKVLKNFLCAIMIAFACISLTACGGSANVKYDLTTSDTYATTMIQKIDGDPFSYKNQTLKVWGKFEKSGNYYTLNENNSCCRWSFELDMENISKMPKSKDNITVVGKCVPEKVNGRSTWHLEVTEIV